MRVLLEVFQQLSHEHLLLSQMVSALGEEKVGS